MSGLKIGLVLDDSLDSTDGVQQYVLTLGAWLSSQGHSVHYLVGQTKRQDIAQIHSLSRNIGVRFNGNRMTMPLPASKRNIRELLTREKFDVLHVQMPYSPFLAGRIIKAANAQTAVLATFHILPVSPTVRLANRALRWLVRGSLKRIDQIMSVSSAAQKFVRDVYSADSVVVPNTAPLTDFFAAQPFAEYNNVRTIVFLGRLVERKGCLHLLHAVHNLHGAATLAGEDVRVIICGGGPLEASLKKYVQEHGLSHVVTFAGRVSEADKPRYLASGDVVVFPSTGGESFGIVLIEAMAAARGVVLAGDNPGYASVMAQRPQALFNPKNTQAFAELLATMLEDDNARKQAHAWQQEYVRQFDAPAVGERVVAAYTSALHKRQA
jgi:phosphatidyl-myo-inositol alpha-mannosyltransferase